MPTHPDDADFFLWTREQAALAGSAVGRLIHPPPVVSVLRLSGIIMAGGGMLRGGLNIANQAGPIAAAFKPRRLAAVALVVNSPGGAAAQSALVARRIRAHAAERDVPVVAFVEDVVSATTRF